MNYSSYDVHTGNWNDIFINRTDVTPILPDSLNPLGRIRSLDVYESDLIVSDGMNGYILIVNDESRVRAVIGRHGHGPGEFQLLSLISTGDRGAVWGFDMNGYRLVKFALVEGEYRLHDEIRLNHSLIQFKQYKSQLFTYSLSASNAISVYDSTGVHIKSTFELNNDNLRKRMLRFQGGGMDVSSNGVIYAISPLAYEVIVFDENLRHIDTLRWAHQSKWRPNVPAPPADSSPYGFSEKDKTWWNSFLHIGRLHLINDEYILVWLYEEDQEIGLSQYANIYSINGDILVEGLFVPKGEYIVGTGRGVIYTSKEAHLSDHSLNNREESGYRLEDTSIYRYDFTLKTQTHAE